MNLGFADRWKIFWILLLIAAGIIIINGATSEISLGDESHHYRFAQNILLAGERVAFDPLYQSGNPPGFFYTTPPLWRFILAFLWKIIGGISQAVAQIYHVLFFVLLVWLTSVLAKEMMGEERRWPPTLIIATVPMVVSFSTLFYMDVPMTALSTLSFYLILKKRYIEAGVASGLAYFTKLNSGFFFPGFLLVIFWNERKEFWRLLKSLGFFILPILLIYGQRRIIWTAVGASEGYRLAKNGLCFPFWPNNPDEMDNIVRANKIDHILIKKSRIYDDHKQHHLGGYPQSFVGKLSLLDGWTKIFENPGVALWRKAK